MFEFVTPANATEGSAELGVQSETFCFIGPEQ